MPNTASPEQERLQGLDDLLETWKVRFLESVEDAPEPGDAGELDEAYAERFKETNKRLFDLNDRLNPEDFDPEALAEIRDRIIRWIAALEEFDRDQPLDRIDYFLVHAEAIRHIIRDALDAHVDGAGHDSREILANLQTWLPRTRQSSLAELVGISTRQLQRWRKEGGKPTRRLQSVARLIALLRRAWHEEGILAWFYRPHNDLEGRAPIEVLEDPEFEHPLALAARQGRAQHGS